MLVEAVHSSVSVVLGTNDRVAHPKYWVAILVQMNTERKVSSKLSSLGIVNYVPLQNEVHQWSDRRKKIERVVIPMVVFVLVNNKEEIKLRTYSFVRKVFSYPGQKEAARIPDSQIEMLKFMLDNADSKVEFSNCNFEVGDAVEIIRGPLKGLVGELYVVDGNKHNVGVRIDLFGCASVSVKRSDIIRIH